MTGQIIPLVKVSQNKEYIIESVSYFDNYSTDLHGYGIMPGTKIKLLFASPSKDPSAYEIMGTVIALRQNDSKRIFVSEYNI